MKYLSVPDFHFSPSWADTSKEVGAAILRAAKDNDVDFIAFVGDLFDAPLTNTDKGGINILRGIIKNLLDYCPVVMIEGTPSHDGPGCYGFLEDIGVKLLKPNHTYGYYKDMFGTNVLDVTSTIDAPECVLFGIPEISKKNIQAQYSLSSGDATSTTLEYFNQYIKSYVAPMRLKYNSVPAFGFLHGNVSDSKQENNSDVVMRQSDLIIYTDDLRIANLTRWEFGHIHTPWESEIINGGYAGFTGIDRNPYGKRDFVPAMHLVDEEGAISRIPYGTPMRVKITKPLDVYSKDIAYWLCSDDPKAELPMDKIHPWSRVTFNEKTETTRRVTEEEAKDVKSLSDLLTLLDPAATDKQKELIDTIPTYNTSNRLDVDVRLQELEVKGCKFFNSKTVKFDASILPSTVTEIFGQNGSGKSSLLAFCTPYPQIVGKDTQNRISAISPFFNQKDSSIRKVFTVNGVKHEHLINIKGAHTKSSKNECYLTINGKPQLDCGTFDEMMEMCEKLYGSFSDYVLTSFYVQPLQSSKLSSGLMSATMKDVRNLVQNIAGIDRSKEKAYALAQALEFGKKKTEKENWLVGFTDSLDDPDLLAIQKEAQIKVIDELNTKLQTITTQGKELNIKVTELLSKQAASDLLINQEIADKKKLNELQIELSNCNKSIQDIQTAANNANVIKNKIEQSNKNYEINNSIQAIINRNSILQNQYYKDINALKNKLQSVQFEFTTNCNNIRNNNDKRQHEYVTKVNEISDAIAKLNREYENKCNEKLDVYNKEVKAYESENSRMAYEIDVQKRNIESYKKQIEIANKPCSACGHIEEDLQATIDLNKNYIDNCNTNIERLNHELRENVPPIEYVKPAQSELIAQHRSEYESLVKPVDMPIPETTSEIEDLKRKINEFAEPEYEAVPDMKPVLDEFELQTLQQQLSDISLGNSRIAEYQAKIANINATIEELSKKTYNIDHNLNDEIRSMQNNVDEFRAMYTKIKEEIATANTELIAIKNDIDDYNCKIERIEGEKAQLESIVDDCNCWDYIAKMLNPNKIPALELEMMLSSIDAEATRIISSYQDGRFIFETKTQNDNGADKFDILVYDSTTGDKRSFMEFSVGQKAFLSDAYTKALVRERNTNGTRIYSPVVMDESDGPVDPTAVGGYYEVQKNYWNIPVLIVSHNPASQEYIENRINISDLITQ